MPIMKNCVQEGVVSPHLLALHWLGLMMRFQHKGQGRVEVWASLAYFREAPEADRSHRGFCTVSATQGGKPSAPGETSSFAI